jgi:hypothetical protein
MLFDQRLTSRSSAKAPHTYNAVGLQSEAMANPNQRCAEPQQIDLNFCQLGGSLVALFLSFSALLRSSTCTVLKAKYREQK